MPASLYGYALNGPPPENRRRWLAWLIAVPVVLLGVGIPAAVGAVLQWGDVAAGAGHVGQAVGTTLLAAFLLLLLVVVLASIPGRWRFHRRRDARSAAVEHRAPKIVASQDVAPEAETEGRPPASSARR